MVKKIVCCMAVLSIAVLVACGKDQHTWRGGLYKVWEPKGKHVGVMILHQGHDCFDGCASSDTNLVPVAERFAAAGFLVYGFEMPPYPHDTGPVERYYRPVLDLIATLPTDVPVYMAGLSGGGWTTTVVTALEPRVKRGYSVSGDVPPDVRPIDVDCFEQLHPPFGYRELYAMAGDRLLHIYNFNEGGHFGGLSGDLGYRYLNHYSAGLHTFSSETVEFILSDLKHY